MRMRVVVAYDVSTETKEGKRRLTRIARAMKGYGVRVQKSVFECDIDTSQIEKLRMVAETLMDMREDSVLMYRLGSCCEKFTLRLGKAAGDPHDLEGFVL